VGVREGMADPQTFAERLEALVEQTVDLHLSNRDTPFHGVVGSVGRDCVVLLCGAQRAPHTFAMSHVVGFAPPAGPGSAFGSQPPGG
jgi:hypothetical protein